MLAKQLFKLIELNFWRLVVGGLKISRPFTSILHRQKGILQTAKVQNSSFTLQLSQALTAWFIGMAIGYSLFS